ncbi:MAG: protein phosphatase 2C domain-containing protein [Chloroflexota bacterium]|nr:protein phosphatase 2C domain-containing protein [Chloroflexota bacterium]
MNFFRRLRVTAENKPGDTKPTAVPSSLESAQATISTAELVSKAPLPLRADIQFGDGATRPLNEDVLLSFLTPRHMQFGQITDTGIVRNNNQDSAFSFFATNRSVDEHPDFGLFIIADGMGGHHDGEKASAITVHTVAQKLLKNVYLPMLDKGSDNSASINEALVGAIEAANNQVNTTVPDSGTTVTGLILIKDLAYIAHVGDSRLYVITKTGIERITRDHSIVQRLIELDQITPDEAAEHPQKHVLYRAVGQTEVIEVDTLTRRLPAHARLLLCSDGLWGMVEESDLIEIVMAAAQPQDACQKLVALANKRGGMDNITAILIFMPD